MSNFFGSLLDFKNLDWGSLALKGVFIYLFIFSIALVLWVARDIVSRSRNLAFQVIAILLVIFLNVFGVLIYLILRPQKTLLESYQDDFEQKALLESEDACPECSRILPLQFQFCPHCGFQARHACHKCKKLVSKNWLACPYCGIKKS